jgi:MoxR-like ATPase
MSTGKLIKSKNVQSPDNQLERNVFDIVHKAIPQYQVEVDDEEWQNADEEVKAAFEKANGQIQQHIRQVKEVISSIESRFANSDQNLSEELQKIKDEIQKIKIRKPIEVVVKIDNKKPNDLGTQHFQFPELLKILATKLNVYLVGPAGSGKTTAAINCAKAFDIPFHFTGAIASEFKLTGFINAQGQIVSTEFRKAYESGGLFLFDEIDASYPQAVLAFNAALANDYMDFPDKRIERHRNFYCIAAANTFGQGADRQYIGRNQLDAASLDRFVFIDWKFDENLERELAANDEWVDFVQDVRRIISELKIRHVVSPRASIFGARLIEAGLSRKRSKNRLSGKGSTYLRLVRSLKIWRITSMTLKLMKRKKK